MLAFTMALRPAPLVTFLGAPEVCQVRPGPAGRRGVNEAISSRNSEKSSNGCNPRPTKGEPAQSVVSLAAAPVTLSSKRRHASVWAVGSSPEIYDIPGAQGVWQPESNIVRVAIGQESVRPGGIYDHGTQEEDDPVTWETLIHPGGKPETWRIRHFKTPTRCAYAVTRVADQEKYPSPGSPTARADHSRGRSG